MLTLKQYLDQDGTYGAHGGSSLSAIGGTIRLGELLPGNVIRHTLKVIFPITSLAIRTYTITDKYRWHSLLSFSLHEMAGYLQLRQVSI